MSGERAYVDTRVGDVDRAARVADIAADTWGLSRPVLLRHGMNVIFRARDVILRVSEPTVPAVGSIELAHMLTAAGIPVVQPVQVEAVEADGLSATAWDYVETTGAPIDWAAVGAAIRRVHDIPSDRLPAGIPQPSPAAFPWWSFDALLAETRDALDAAARTGIERAITRWAGWDDWEPTRAVVCHGDVHPGNVIMTAAGPVLIDWDLVCLAPPGWDHAPMMTWAARWGGARGEYAAFAEGYGFSARGDDSAEAFAELRLVAATLMRVKAGIDDPVARPEAERRLAYWRGDEDAPIWRAQ